MFEKSRIEDSVFKNLDSSTIRKLVIWTALAVIITIGAGFRTIGLSQAIVWYDEVFTFMHMSGTFANSDRDEYSLITRCLKSPVDWKSLVDEYQYRKCPLSDVRLSTINRSPAHAPWFYEAIYLWNAFAKNNDGTLRLLPLLFGILTLPAFYWLAFELFGSPGIALLATTMMALSPIQIIYSQELREYSLYALVFSITCAAFLKAWRENTMDTWALFTCASAISYCCSFWMLLVTAAQVAYAAGSTVIRKQQQRPDLRKFGILLALVALSVCVVSPVILDLVCNLQQVKQMLLWVELPVDTSQSGNAWLFGRLFGWMFHPSYGYVHGNSKLADANNPVLILVLIIELCSLWYLAKKERPQFAFLLLIALAFAAVLDLPDLLFGGRRSLNMRYFLPVTMIAFLPVCYLIEGLWRSRSKARRVAAIAILAFLTGTQLYSDLTLKDCREHGSVMYMMEPVAKVLNEAPDNSIVIVDKQPHILANILALGRLMNRPLPIAWFMDNVPDWFKNVDRAYLIFAEPDAEKRYVDLGFTATRLQKDLVLLSRSEIHSSAKQR